MNLFLSAGEPSGDLHGANLIRELKTRIPSASFSGFGGQKMADAGSKLLYPLTDLAVMWFGRAIWNIRTFMGLLDRAEEHFRTKKPDALVVIDFPGFHWHLAKRAHRCGIPVYYFQPPQLWAWGGWRVKKVKDRIDTVFTSLPFEDEWYQARGVKTQYIGHPYFDEIASQKLDETFLAEHRQSPSPIVGILPGSRHQEIRNNFETQLLTAKRILAARPDARIFVASFNDEQARVVKEKAAAANVPVSIHVGRTPEIIELSKACVAVSGSVGLELLCRTTPSVVIYKINEISRLIGRSFMTVPHISLVNLLAKAELFPEYLTSRDRSPEAAGHVLSWLNDSEKRSALVRQLEELRAKYAKTGACGRAADTIANALGQRESLRSAA
ncbi:MAG: lipid-A-disaccharide synthase [Gemmataceae bacterium]